MRACRLYLACCQPANALGLTAPKTDEIAGGLANNGGCLEVVWRGFSGFLIEE